MLIVIKFEGKIDYYFLMRLFLLSPICINMSFQELFTQILPNVQKMDIIVIKKLGGAMLNYAIMSMKKEPP